MGRVCVNECVLSELSWRIYAGRSALSATLSVLLFPALASLRPLSLLPGMTHDSPVKSEYTSPSGSELWKKAQRPQAVYLRRPRSLLSAGAPARGRFGRLGGGLGFGGCECLGPLPVHFGCVALQCLGFRRQLRENKELWSDQLELETHMVLLTKP